MEWYKAGILIFTGLIAGFINTVAGGGSLITLPVMIFLGLPPVVANGTNRIALFLQNISAIAGFRSKGIFVFPYSLWLALSALLGAGLGAKISVELSGQTFERILAIVMILVVVLTVFHRTNDQSSQTEKLDGYHKVFGIIAFFFVGIYGGFIQAGVGFIVLGSLTWINRLSLVRANSIKVFVIFIYTFAALGVFIYENKVNWLYGLILAVGNVTGAWIASRWSVEKGDKWIRRILLVAVSIMSIKLWFF